MKKVFIVCIQGYRFTERFLRKIGLIRYSCCFYPTCSQYAMDALEKYGALKGSWLSIKRICRCHPWQENHFDPA